jgi:hypothetical protein
MIVIIKPASSLRYKLSPLQLVGRKTPGFLRRNYLNKQILISQPFGKPLFLVSSKNAKAGDK